MAGGLIVDKTEEIIRHAQQFARRPKDSPAGYRSHLTKEERELFDRHLLIERQIWSKSKGKHYNGPSYTLWRVR